MLQRAPILILMGPVTPRHRPLGPSPHQGRAVITPDERQHPALRSLSMNATLTRARPIPTH